MSKQPGKNVTKIQTPGATAADQPGNDSDNGAVHDDAQGTAQATATKVAPKTVQAESRVQNRPGRAQYAQMRAADVDPTTLKSAVLTLDGWVCPPTIGTVNPK